MGQKCFYFDMTSCTGCKCCQVACKDANDLAVGRFYRKATDFEGGKFPKMWAATLSMGCNHCMDAPCVKNCPTGALKKRTEDGLVIQDNSMCIGCRMCEMSCPYGAPSWNPETGKIEKCDACLTRFLDKNMQPACVGACSTRALQFGDWEELKNLHSKENLVSDLSVLPSSTLSHPSLLISAKEKLL